MTDKGKVIGTRGITVNVLSGDTELDIALRIINTVLDEYNDRKDKPDDQN